MTSQDSAAMRGSPAGRERREDTGMFELAGWLSRADRFRRLEKANPRRHPPRSSK